MAREPTTTGTTAAHTPAEVEWRHTAQPVSGKGVIVTGGTTGIGRAIALLLAANGAKVLVFGRHQKQLDEAMADLLKVGRDVHGMTADAASRRDVERVFAEADKRLGRLDVLVNNVGIAPDSLDETDDDEIDYVVRTNVTSYLHFARHAAERMRKHGGGGHIINVGSLSADERGGGSPVYVATRSAIQGFSESLGKSLAEDGIKVSLIEPGAVGTDMQPDKESHEQKAAEGKFLRAEDIAACVYFCLSQPKRCDVRVIKVQPHAQERK